RDNDCERSARSSQADPVAPTGTCRAKTSAAETGGSASAASVPTASPAAAASTSATAGWLVRDFPVSDGAASAARCDDGERFAAGDRQIDGQSCKIPRSARERALKQHGVAAAWDLDGAKTPQMLGNVLRVEQFEAAGDQPRHKMHERHLRGVAHAVEHALSEEGASKPHAVESADQSTVLPDFAAVSVAERMQSAIEVADALVDPGVLAPGLGCGAACNDRVECRAAPQPGREDTWINKRI